MMISIDVVVGIVKRDGKVLVGQRPEGKPYSGYWEFPGGKIEKEELALDALRRELSEELGIAVMQAESWFEHCHQYPDKIVLLKIWQVKEFLGEPQAKEGQCLRWVTFPEILALQLLAGNWPIIDKIKSLFGKE